MGRRYVMLWLPYAVLLGIRPGRACRYQDTCNNMAHNETLGVVIAVLWVLLNLSQLASHAGGQQEPKQCMKRDSTG